MTLHSNTGNELAHSFVPRLLINYVATRVRNGKESLKAKSFFFHGVCLIVDISGFTALSEGFCDAGKKGIDGLQVCTNVYIGELVAVVYAHGGDIIKFAGDALVCVFAEETFTDALMSSKGPTVSVDVLLRAVQCAQQVREIRTERLTVHVGLSCGEMCFGILGGVENRWECLISGPCIQELSNCLDDASSMQAVMTAECLEVLKAYAAPQISINTESNKTLSDSDVQRYSVSSGAGRYEVQLLTLSSGNQRIVDVTLDTMATRQPSFQDRSLLAVTTHAELDTAQRSVLDALIRQFVPAPIVEELDRVTGLSYFAEIREVTTMFMKWDSYDPENKHKDLMSLQSCFYQAQRILTETGAYLRQFLVDDKGCVLIACWGMPHLSYLDNAHRALSAAAQIRHEFDRKQMQTSVGITCADVYCGTVGSLERMEYAAIGSEVNMAARIMGKAKGRLLVGQSAYSRLPTADLDLLQAIDPFIVKGKAEPMQAFHFIAAAATGTAGGSLQTDTAAADGPSELDVPPACRAALQGLLVSLNSLPDSPSRHTFGSPFSFGSQDVRTPPSRKPQPQQQQHGQHMKRQESLEGEKSFTRSISRMSFATPFTVRTTTHPATVMVIDGGRGTGKSCVAAWVRAQAAKCHVSTVSARLTKQTGHKPYTLWKKIFHQLTVQADFRSNDGQWSHVHELFSEVFPNLSQLSEHVSLFALSEALGVGTTFSDRIAPSAGTHAQKKDPGSSSFSTLLSRKPTHANDGAYLRDALVKVFAHLLNQQPALIILENIHLADEQSLDLLARLVPKLAHPNAVLLTALVVATEPAGQPSAKQGGPVKNASAGPGSLLYAKDESSSTLPQGSISEKLGNVEADFLRNTPWCRSHRDQLLKRKNASVVTLNKYTSSDIDAMLCTALSIATAPPEISQLVQDFSGGSYFWVREILQFIKEHGPEQFLVSLGMKKDPAGASEKLAPFSTPARRRSSIVMAAPLEKDGELVRQILAFPSFQSPNSHRIVSAPHQVQLDKLVLCRFGGLSADAQRVLRTASIIGATFTVIVLHAVLPVHLKPQVHASLHALVNQKWLFQDNDNEQLFAFAHPHAHQIIYELTPASERNHLYGQIAQCVEQRHGNNPEQYAALSHYFLHCDSDKALQYVCKALPVLLTVESVYDFADAVDLLGSSLPACNTTYDVEVMMFLLERSRRCIQQFGMKTVGTTKRQMSHRGPPKPSIARFLTSCLPEGLQIAPEYDDDIVEPSEAVDPEKRKRFMELMRKPIPVYKDTLRESEQEARALFVKQLDKINLQLSYIYVELAEAQTQYEPQQWQVALLDARNPGNKKKSNKSSNQEQG